MDGAKPPKRRKPKKKKHDFKYQPTIGEELEVVERDKVTLTDADENKRRRALYLTRQNGSWGFTLQSYGVHHKTASTLEVLTYIDYVDPGGAAFLAGVRAGDVILSINGTNMEEAEHQDLVNYIKTCGDSMRMVVLFEDCCKKVELHLRFLKLKRVLAEKLFELRSLEIQEGRVMCGKSRFGSRRNSLTSNSSMDSNIDDRMSLLPELDVFPLSPAAQSPIEDDDISISSPLGAVGGTNFPFRNRFEFDRCSLPVGSSGSSGSLNHSVSSSSTFVRERRPMSMRLQSPSCSSVVDVHLPVPQKYNPALLHHSASLTSFGSIRSLDSSSLYRHSKSGSNLSLRRASPERANSSYLYRKALNSSSRSLRPASSAPDYPSYEMPELHTHEESLESLAAETATPSGGAQGNPSTSSPGVDPKTESPRLSPIFFTAHSTSKQKNPAQNSPVDKNGNEKYPLDGTPKLTIYNSDKLGPQVDMPKVIIEPLGESSTDNVADNVSDVDAHDLSLDSIEIYGFDTSSEEEEVESVTEEMKESATDKGTASQTGSSVKQNPSSLVEEEEKVDPNTVPQDVGNIHTVMAGRQNQGAELTKSNTHEKCTSSDVKGKQDEDTSAYERLTEQVTSPKQVMKSFEESIPVILENYDTSQSECDRANGGGKIIVNPPPDNSESNRSHVGAANQNISVSEDSILNFGRHPNENIVNGTNELKTDHKGILGTKTGGSLRENVNCNLKNESESSIPQNVDAFVGRHSPKGRGKTAFITVRDQTRRSLSDEKLSFVENVSPEADIGTMNDISVTTKVIPRKSFNESSGCETVTGSERSDTCLCNHSPRQHKPKINQNSSEKLCLFQNSDYGPVEMVQPPSDYVRRDSSELGPCTPDVEVTSIKLNVVKQNLAASVHLDQHPELTSYKPTQDLQAQCQDCGVAPSGGKPDNQSLGHLVKSDGVRQEVPPLVVEQEVKGAGGIQPNSETRPGMGSVAMEIMPYRGCGLKFDYVSDRDEHTWL